MRLNWGATIPFPEKFLYNKRDIMTNSPLTFLKYNIPMSERGSE